MRPDTVRIGHPSYRLVPPPPKPLPLPLHYQWKGGKGGRREVGTDGGSPTVPLPRVGETSEGTYRGQGAEKVVKDIEEFNSSS